MHGANRGLSTDISRADDSRFAPISEREVLFSLVPKQRAAQDQLQMSTANTHAANSPHSKSNASKPESARIDPETVTISGYAVGERYGPDSVVTQDPTDPSKAHARIGEAGEYPFTRGVHKTMYRSRLWTMQSVH